MAQEVWPSRAKVLVPPQRERGGRGGGGTRSLALEGQTSCAIQEGAGRTGGEYHGFVPPSMAYSKISSAI